MQRKTKNIISIVIILLLCGSIVFMGYLSTKANNNMSNMSQNGNKPPEMPNGNEGEPPEKPEGEMSAEQENSNLNMEEPPEKPDGDNSMGTPPEMPNNNGGMEPMGGQQENNIYLILLGIESLTLSIIVLYLIMSKFNKKSFKETFINPDKILIYILGVIILTTGLTFTENLVVNKFRDNANSNNNPNQSMGAEQNANISYSAVKEITKSVTETSGDYESAEKDKNAILVSGEEEVQQQIIQIVMVPK